MPKSAEPKISTDSEHKKKDKSSRKKRKSRTRGDSPEAQKPEEATALCHVKDDQPEKTASEDAPAPVSPADEDTEMAESEPQPSTSTDTFSSFYMKAVTMAFANDLDKIRGASDFSDASLPLLVKALQQGEECFGVEERRAVEAAGRK